MNKAQAVVAGVVGGIIMSVLMAFGRIVGIRVHLEMSLGSLLGLPPDAATWTWGFVVHLVMSGLIGLAYGAVFEFLLHRADWRRGLGLSLIHLMIAGMALSFVPTLHSQSIEALPAPGAFMSSSGGEGVCMFVVLHMIYGSLVGGIYELRQKRQGPQQRSKPFDPQSKVA